MTTPTTAWDETAPADSSSFSLGDDSIRDLKTQLREIINVDHEMGYPSGSGDEWGYHNKVTLLEQASDPAASSDALKFYTKEISGNAELFSIDASGVITQLTATGSFLGGMSSEIRMWSGALASIPTGWALCDGTGTTINLIGKFIYGSSTPGAGGGSDTASLSGIPTHYHSQTADGGHAHTMYLAASNTVGAPRIGNDTWTGVWDGYSASANGYITSTNSTHTHTSDSAGSGATFNNRPAYVELAYIQRS